MGDTTDTCIGIKWNKRELAFSLPSSETVGALKQRIADETRVSVKRQKLLGLKVKGKASVSDDVLLCGPDTQAWAEDHPDGDP